MTSRYPQRLPDVRRGVKRILPGAMDRNRRPLLYTSGSPSLLYTPDGYNDDSMWDEERQTYRYEDVKYKLYLNQDKDSDGNRLYTNDTDTVPSILVGYPSNADSTQHKEEGLVLINQIQAWTLWKPIIPQRGSLLIRPTSGAEGSNYLEVWLLENVVYSYFPNYPKSDETLMHQEFRLALLTPGSYPIEIDKLPTVDSTLAIYNNSLKYEIDDFDITGSILIQDDLGCQFTGVCTLQKSVNLIENSVKFSIKPSQLQGGVVVNWLKWTDNSKPNWVIDFENQEIRLEAITGNTLVQKDFQFLANTTYVIEVEFRDPYMRILINGREEAKAHIKGYTLYSSRSPLSSGTPTLSSFDTQFSALISDLYYKNLI